MKVWELILILQGYEDNQDIRVEVLEPCCCIEDSTFEIPTVKTLQDGTVALCG